MYTSIEVADQQVDEIEVTRFVTDNYHFGIRIHLTDARFIQITYEELKKLFEECHEVQLAYKTMVFMHERNQEGP